MTEQRKQPGIMGGDIIIIAGANRLDPNPHRRWWQFWKPRMVDSGEPATFRVCEIVASEDRHD